MKISRLISGILLILIGYTIYLFGLNFFKLINFEFTAPIFIVYGLIAIYVNIINENRNKSILTSIIFFLGIVSGVINYFEILDIAGILKFSIITIPLLSLLLVYFLFREKDLLKIISIYIIVLLSGFILLPQPIIKFLSDRILFIVNFIFPYLFFFLGFRLIIKSD